jgi:hypothetical protein
LPALLRGLCLHHVRSFTRAFFVFFFIFIFIFILRENLSHFIAHKLEGSPMYGNDSLTAGDDEHIYGNTAQEW